jgi:hypothetical protein
MYSSELRNTAGENLLCFAKQPGLYEPIKGLDWRVAANYPPLVSPLKFTAAHGRRLAWEFLRRTPRYRWHFERLRARGLIASRQFGDGRSFYTPKDRPHPPEIFAAIEAHEFGPSVPNPGERIYDYVQRHKDQSWWIQHGHDWACRHWGLSFVADPQKDFDELPLDFFTSSSAPRIVGASRKNSHEPLYWSETLAYQEFAVVLRIDASFPAQWAGLQTQLRQHQQAFRKVHSAQKAKLIHKELAPFWLRVWDAHQEERLKQNVEAPLFDHAEVHRVLSEESHAFEAELAKEIQPARREKVVEETVSSAFTKNKILDWLERISAYLVREDSAYRELLFTSADSARRLGAGSTKRAATKDAKSRLR